MNTPKPLILSTLGLLFSHLAETMLSWNSYKLFIHYIETNRDGIYLGA